jgi:hypothetical protein
VAVTIAEIGGHDAGLGSRTRSATPVTMAEMAGHIRRNTHHSGLAAKREVWLQWQHGLSVRITLPDKPPRLRMLLVMDNLAGHHTPSFVGWLFKHGVMPLYTPIGGSWLNLAESMQHILVQRALAGQHLQTPADIIENLQQAARAWNEDPTPFTWGGRRYARRHRARERLHRLAASGACAVRPVRRRSRAVPAQWQPQGCSTLTISSFR